MDRARISQLVAAVVVLSTVVLATSTAGASQRAKQAPLVRIATEADECTTSKTIYLTVGPDGVSALECQGREYNGPLSPAQHDAVLGFATALADGELDAKDRKRIQAYARAAANGDNVAELDTVAAEAEITALITHVFRDVVVDADGALQLGTDDATDRTAKKVAGAFVVLLEDGRMLRADVADLVRTPPPGGLGPIGISAAQVRLDSSLTSAVATIGVYNFRDVLASTACSVDPATLDASCAVELAFSDGSWKLSRRGFDQLFATPVESSAPTTTSTTVS